MAYFLDKNDLQSLLTNLKNDGYQVVAPTVKESAIQYDLIDNLDQLPIGISDQASPGSYKLHDRKDQALFKFNQGANSIRNFLLPPVNKMCEITKTNNQLQYKEIIPESKYAFFGVKPCDLKAIEIQDKVFIAGDYQQGIYKANRDNSLIIATNCTVSNDQCFCTSMKTGPESKSGFDLALTEYIDKDDHFFIATTGSKIGNDIVAKLVLRPAKKEEIEQANKLVENNKNSMPVKVKGNIAAALKEKLEHPQWEKIAEKCLSCANCTLVCPTCFCSTTKDDTSLSGDIANRWLSWDSCFSNSHSYIHGGKVHGSIKSQYRQWLTHKFSFWHDQFDVSGCVGCGRCTTWCPVGIDITKELEILTTE